MCSRIASWHSCSCLPAFIAASGEYRSLPLARSGCCNSASGVTPTNLIASFPTLALSESRQILIVAAEADSRAATPRPTHLKLYRFELLNEGFEKPAVPTTRQVIARLRHET